MIIMSRLVWQKSKFVTALFSMCLAIVALFPCTVRTQTVEWLRAYGGDHRNFGVRVIPTSDSGFAIVGRSFSTGSVTADILLIKLDKFGDSLWSQSYGGPLEASVNDVIQTVDQGYLICGQNPNYRAGMYALRIDNTGGVLWETTIEESGTSSAVIQLPDGSFALAGYIHSGIADVYMGAIVRISAGGDSLWTVTTEEFDTWLVQDLALLHSGEIIATGRFRTFDPIDEDISALVVDTAGTVRWAKSYGDETNYDGRACATLEDGTIIIVGYSHAQFEGSDVMLLQISDDGDSLWATTVGNEHEEIGIDIVANPDGGFTYCASTWTNSQTDYNLLIERYRSPQMKEWSLLIDIAKELSVFSISRDRWGDYVLGGYTEETGGGDPYNMFALKISCCFRAGDADGDDDVTIRDVVFIVKYIFQKANSPGCIDESDADGNGRLNIGDVTYLIARIFGGGPAPVCGTTGN